jgi:hypothetical protein
MERRGGEDRKGGKGERGEDKGERGGHRGKGRTKGMDGGEWRDGEGSERGGD